MVRKGQCVSEREKLRGLLNKRGVGFSTGGLAALLTAEATAAVPAI